MRISTYPTIALGFFSITAGCRDSIPPGATYPPERLEVHGAQIANVAVRMVAEGLTSPVTLLSAPDNSGRLFVVDQIGLIRIITSDGQLLAEPFLDLRAKLVQLSPNSDERGLLGLAFHPAYATNGRFFVNYSAPLRPGAPSGYNHTSTVSEFGVASDANRADASSERKLVEIDKPQGNHNGGTVAFGPDGYLYFSIGDGGGANDVGLGHVEDWYDVNAGGNGQDVDHNLLGNILRLDIDGGAPYAIPHDNPFVGLTGLDEIYAYGLRNPYRFSFDMGGSRELIAGDAGQNLREEIDLVIKGGNYGWNVKEGRNCFSTAHPSQPLPTCPSSAPGGVPLIDPVIDYPNSRTSPTGLGIVVVGGYVYRGSAIPALTGRYVFGDFSRSVQQPDGTIFVAAPGGQTAWPFEELLLTGLPAGRIGHFVPGFGQDGAGEIYILGKLLAGPSGTTGKVFKLVPVTVH